MRRIVALIVVGLVVFGLGAASEASVVLNLNYVFSGDTPTGSAPWLRATFTTTVAGTVDLKLESLLKDSNFVDDADFGWGFNLDPSITPGALTFVGSGRVANTISTGVNAFKADGDGYYDILFKWSSNNSNRFRPGDVAEYTITATALTEQSFNFLSSQGGGEGVYHTAAKVQGIGTSGLSGFIGDSPVPEPASLVVWSVIGAAAGLGAIRRRRRARWSD